MRIANERARAYVARRMAFDGSNMFARRRYVDGGYTRYIYAVFSYSYTWPIFICYNDVWYETSTRVSRTTDRHHEVARPTGVTARKMSIEQMRKLYDSRGASLENMSDADSLFM